MSPILDPGPSKRVKHNRKLRFPDNVIVACTLPIEPSEDSSPREHARSRGATAGRQWICWLFGGSVTPGPKINLKINLPNVHKPTKLAFARLLNAANTDFEAIYHFDRSNGTNQVRAKDIPTNEAYGFWDEINNVADNLDLWEVLNKDTAPFSIPADAHVAADPEESTLQVRQTTRRQAGECNFCSSGDHAVFEVGSDARTLKVRFCKACIKRFKAQTP